MTVTEKTGFIQGIEKKQNLIFWLMLSVIMAVGGILYFRTTPHGVGLVSDSVNYINGARSIAAGNGYFRESGGGILKPLQIFPPLYSIYCPSFLLKRTGLLQSDILLIFLC